MYEVDGKESNRRLSIVLFSIIACIQNAETKQISIWMCEKKRKFWQQKIY